MSVNSVRKARKDRVLIKAGYAPALLKAIQSQKKEWETVPEVIGRLLSLALAKSVRVNRKGRFS